MSSSKSLVKINLDEPSAELKIIDAHFHVIQRGVGTSTFSLDPGVYKVQASAAGAKVEQLFAVYGEGKAEQIDLPAIRFSSAAPLNQTSTSHEYHQGALANAVYRHPMNVGMGTGSTLLFSLRDPGHTCFAQRNASQAAKARYRQSFEGLFLRSATNEQRVDLHDVARFDPDEGYLIAHVQLAPGHYTLSYERAEAPAVAMPMWAVNGYDTQVYMLVEVDEDLLRPGRPDLRERAMVLAPSGRHFHPEDPALRVSEIARRAYSQRRFALADTILDQFLDVHNHFPMLGLFGAHLALQAPGEERTTQLPKLKRVLQRLSRQLGEGFPDVIALELGLYPYLRSSVVSVPPLLRASWQMLQRREYACVAPELSNLLSRANNVGTWLVWKPHAALTAHSSQPGPLGRLMEKQKRDVFLNVVTHATDEDPNLLLELVQGIIASDWWDVAVRWLSKNEANTDVTAGLTSLQATLLAALELARSRPEEDDAFGIEDLEALVRGLGVSNAVASQSLIQLRDLLLSIGAS